MARFSRLATAGLVLTALICAKANAATQSVTVFAAASTVEAVSAITETYERNSGAHIRPVFAGSGSLARQIANGAPADIFISANGAWMDHLEDLGFIVPDTRTVVARNRLVLTGSPCLQSQSRSIPEAIRSTGDEPIALGEPTSVPSGAYAKEALSNLELWRFVEERALFAQSVRTALAWVVRCEAALGIVYASDAHSSVQYGVRTVAPFPTETHTPIRYPAAIVTGNDGPAARDFLAFLTSGDAAAIWIKFGFAESKAPLASESGP